jgi:integrase
MASRRFAGAVRRAGLPRVTPHQLRHTAASLAVIQSGANVRSFRGCSGKSAAMRLDTYADLFDVDLDSVAAATNLAATPYIT